MFKHIVIAGLLLNLNHAIAKTVSEVEIKGEKVEFTAKSNISAIEINGSSKSSTGSVKLSENGGTMTLESLKIVIPVESLSTGIAIRDRHMKDKIFKSEDGKFPDVTFESGKSSCEKSGEGYTCQAQGTINLHGKSHEATIPVAVTKKGDEFEAKANFELGLRDYGIEPPSHFGVAIENGVGLKTMFRGKITGHQESTPAQPVVAKASPVATPVVATVETPVGSAAPVAVSRAPASLPVVAAQLPPAVYHAATAPQQSQTIEIQLADGTIVRGLNFDQVQQVIKQKSQDGRITLSAN